MDVTRSEVMVLSLAFPELKVTVVGNAAIARHIYLAESELDGQATELSRLQKLLNDREETLRRQQDRLKEVGRVAMVPNTS